MSRYLTLILILQNGHLRSFCNHSYQHPSHIRCMHSVFFISFLLSLHTGHYSNWSMGTIFSFFNGAILVFINICFYRDIALAELDGYGFYTYCFYSCAFYSCTPWEMFELDFYCWVFFIYSIIDFKDGSRSLL